MKRFAILLAAIVALLRPLFLLVDVNKHVDMSYQAVAHGLVAGLFVGYGIAYSLLRTYVGFVYAKEKATWMLQTGLALVGVEIVCGVVIPIVRKLFA